MAIAWKITTEVYQVCVTIVQDNLYNIKKRLSDSVVKRRHTVECDPQLHWPQHTSTRSKNLIQQLYSISYDRELENTFLLSFCLGEADIFVCLGSYMKYSKWIPVCMQQRHFQDQQHILYNPNWQGSCTYVEGSGGCIGFTAGPDLAWWQKQFQEQYLHDDDPKNPKNSQNHEQDVLEMPVNHAVMLPLRKDSWRGQENSAWLGNE